MPPGFALGVMAAASAHRGPSSVRCCGTAPGMVETLQECVDKLDAPGSSCTIEPGTYTGPFPVQITAKHGTPEQPIVLRGLGDDPAHVLFDGTVDLRSDAVWRPRPDVANGVFSTSLPVGTPPIYQLFVDGVMQTPARWPNARFDDRSIYMAPEKWAHSMAAPNSQHNITSRLGVLVDAGACPNSTVCCAYCNNNSLAASGVNASGAVIVMNMWGNGVGQELIPSWGHAPGQDTIRYTATWCREEILKRGKCSDGFRQGKGRYYLEGKLDLLDSPTEWYYDELARELFYFPIHGNPAGRIHYKNSPYAFNITDSSHLIVANATFFATALVAQDDDSNLGVPRVHNIRFESLDFQYPAASRRSLRDLSPIDSTVIWTDMKSSREAAWTNHSLIDVSWSFADGTALQFQGSGAYFENCAWYWNSWTGLCSSAPWQWDGNCGTFVVSGRPSPLNKAQFYRLSFANNGASKCLRPGESRDFAHPTRIEAVHFEAQLQMADDGCFVETGGNFSAHMVANWCHGSGKSALRFDGTSESGTAHGAMLSNVAWNVSSFEVKGDSHNVSYNTAFDGSDIGASWANASRPRAQSPLAPLDETGEMLSESITVENPGHYTSFANTRSVFLGNLFDSAKPKDDCSPKLKYCPLAGNWHDSVIGTAMGAPSNTSAQLFRFDVRSQLRDPYFRDFRRCPGSLADRKRAGAYPTWTETDTVYHIPGAKQRNASQPIPENGGTNVIADTDLIFLGAFRAVGHKVFFGAQPLALAEVARLDGEANVVNAARLALTVPGQSYYWRVDAEFSDGQIRTGNVWRFSTGVRRSCPLQPQPPPPPCVPTPCRKALNICCADVKGMGNKCLHHIARHNHSLTPPPANCTRSDEYLYCGFGARTTSNVTP